MTSLRAGDIVWVNFEPVKGSEQGGVHPAIVLTSSEFHERSNKATVCPITRNANPWPSKIELPSQMTTRGYILADQVRTMHRAERGFRFIERAPDQVLAQVRQVLGGILGITA